ncbi:hypothetical protein QFC20_003356 [Naganishia adeliensis]|uniref:Uncharacterized protein n=1 Tax=Naganishia adeliensis TaxID=92952 RepID=A0ACC2WC56_9TREE|nr:hypothetical protein QFC20_003356 [Naganishia adeliensis]
MSDDAIRMLEFRFEDEETGFGVMPGWDEVIEVPPEFEPPRLENDEILPTKIHPSWPLGRPLYLSHPPTASFGQVSLNNARGRTAPEVQRLLGRLGLAPNALRNTRTIWSDWGLKSTAEEQNGIFVGVVEDESREEIAPGMAGAQRSPTPPSPQIRRKRSRSPSTSSNTSGYPDSPPPQATAATTSRPSRTTDAAEHTPMSSRASTPGTEGSVSAVTEPLNDDHAMSVDEDAAERDASRVRRRWTRRRRNTGTRGNPLDWLDGAAEGDGPV